MAENDETIIEDTPEPDAQSLVTLIAVLQRDREPANGFEALAREIVAEEISFSIAAWATEVDAQAKVFIDERTAKLAPLLRSAKKTWDEACALRDSILDGPKKARALLSGVGAKEIFGTPSGGVIGAWNVELARRERVANEERQRKAREEAQRERAQREKEAREAAEERTRQAKIAADEAKRLADEAAERERAAAEAAAEGNIGKAVEAQAEADQAKVAASEATAQAETKAGEAEHLERAADMIHETPLQVVIAHAPVTTDLQLTGVSTRYVYECEVIDYIALAKTLLEDDPKGTRFMMVFVNGKPAREQINKGAADLAGKEFKFDEKQVKWSQYPANSNRGGRKRSA